MGWGLATLESRPSPGPVPEVPETQRCPGGTCVDPQRGPFPTLWDAETWPWCHWHVWVCVDVYRRAGVCRHVLVYLDVRRCMQVCAGVC